MAKKKRKHRTPIAPPVHSAPGTAHAPARPATSPARPATTASPSAPASPDVPAVPVAPSRPRRETPGSRQAAKRRKSRRRTYLILATIVALIVVAIVGQRMISSRAINAFNTLAKSAGCGSIQKTSSSGEQDHLGEGEKTTYEESPPTHGKHAGSALGAGVYEEPLSDDPLEDNTIYKAVHSLEHGAIVVWYDGLEDDDVDELSRKYGGEEKVIVTPFPQLRGDDHVAMTAWGRSVKCKEMSTDVIDSFIDVFRGARTAPEPNSAI
jgi:hypothetical protein